MNVISYYIAQFARYLLFQIQCCSIHLIEFQRSTLPLFLLLILSISDRIIFITVLGKYLFQQIRYILVLLGIRNAMTDGQGETIE